MGGLRFFLSCAIDRQAGQSYVGCGCLRMLTTEKKTLQGTYVEVALAAVRRRYERECHVK